MRTVAPPKRDGKLYPGIHLGESVVSDMIRIACVACRAKIGVNPVQIGSKIRCPKCMEEFVAAKPAVAKAVAAEPVDEELEEEFREEKADLKKKKRRKEKAAAEGLVTTMMAGGGILLLLVVAGIAYLFIGSPPPVAPDKPDITVDADTIYSHYHENVADANKKYTGKWVKVDGAVRSVTVNNRGQYCIFMLGGWDNSGIVIYCSQEDAAKVRYNSQISAFGYVKKFDYGAVYIMYSKIEVKAL